MAWIDAFKRWLYRSTSGIMTDGTRSECDWLQFEVGASDIISETEKKENINA